MIDRINKVREFHDAFKIENLENPEPNLPERDYLLRHRLIAEENDEYLEACKNGDITEIADALGDILYIAFGTALKHGLQHKMEEVFDEIHRSNMSKLDDNKQPIIREDGKILKSSNYFKPNIGQIINS